MEVATLDALIKQGIQDAINSDALRQAIKTHAEKAVSESISSAFARNSDFRKSIEAAIKQVLPIPDASDLAEFAHATRTVIQRRLSLLADETAQKHLDEVLAKLIPDTPEISLGDLKEAFVEKVKRELGLEDYDDDDCYSHYEWDISEGSVDGYWHLEAAFQHDRKKIDMHLSFRELKGSPGLNECWMCRAGQNDVALTSLFTGPLYGFDAMVFRLRTGTAKLRK